MNENIDLTKILEGCEGIELYSPITGNCILDDIQADTLYPIIITNEDKDDFQIFTKRGRLYSKYPNAECLLFPSKEQHDWSKFVRPIKRGTPMMCSDDKGIWTLMLYEMCKEHEHYVSRIYTRDALKFKYMIRFEDFNPNDIEGSLEYNIQNNGD